MSQPSASLTEVLAPVKHILLDFDGPICSVFAGVSASEVARRLLGDLAAEEKHVPDHWWDENDPLALLVRIADDRPQLTQRADAALTALETEAVSQARPTPQAVDTLRAATASGRTVHIVSNNSGRCIQEYLAAHNLSGHVAGVFGRVPSEPASMKPSPRLLLDAMSAAGAQPAECLFLGDAVRDVHAGDAAGIRTVGYANKVGKRETLSSTSAVVVVDSMGTIADALMTMSS